MSSRHRCIFVFGSNRAGRHGLGAARCAARDWGAVYGVGEGMTGQAYALPTRDHRIQTLPLAEIATHVDRFVDCAQYYYRNWFLLTEVGCGHAGYQARDVLPLFRRAVPLANVYWPERWAARLGIARVSFDTANNLLAGNRG